MKKKVMLWYREHRNLLKVLMIMKFIVLFTLTMTLQVSANVYSQNVLFDIDLQNATIKKVFNTIKNQSEFSFLYSDEDIQMIKRQNLTLKDATIEEVLDASLQGQNLEYEIFEEVIIVRPSKKPLESTDIVEEPQQKITITGKVIDDEGNSLPGANILEKGTTNGVITDLNGNYTIDIESSESVLVFSFVSYEKQEVIVGNKTVIDVTLKSTFSELNELVVVGYGSTKVKDLTGEVSRLDPKVLETTTSATLGSILQGQLAGVEVLSGSGEPGAPVRIRIRGDASINQGADPLIVVNGVQMPGEFNLNDINPNDIEAVDVLKGASASSIYGSRASAGVIEITTKKGTEYTAPEISYSYNFGVKVLQNDIQSLDGEQFVDMFEEGLINYIMGRYGVRTEEEAINYTTSSGTQMYETYFLEEGKFGTSNTNWIDLLLKRATTERHYLSLRGGDKKIRYAFSYGLDNEKGMLVGTDFKRHTANFNYDQNFNDNVKVGFNLMGNISNRNNTIDINTVTSMRSDVPAYNEDGSYFIHTYIYRGNERWNDNPLILANETTNNTKAKYFSLNPYAEIKFLKDFKFTTRYSYYTNIGNSKQHYPSNTKKGENYGGLLYDSNYESNTEIFTNYFSYLKEFGDHDIISILGMEYSEERFLTSREAYTNFADDKIQIAPWQAADYSGASGDAYETASVSYYGRVNYKYKDRYLLTASLRRDGSSRFAPEYRYGLFPSLAIAYIVSDEPFFKSIKKTVDLFKIRISGGKTGNNRVGAYNWLAEYQSGIDYLGLPGVRPISIGNEFLKWESATEYNLGIDFGFLKNSRIKGSVDIYQKNINDMLFGMPMAPSTGVTTVYQNFADLTNKGIELNLSGVVINRNNFNWTIGFNIFKNKNIINNLGIERASKNDGSTSLNYYLMEEGKPLGLIYGYQTDGLFQSWEEVDEYEALNPDESYQGSSSILTMPGDIKFVDVSGDGYISAGTGSDDDPEEDRRIIGNTQPNFRGGCYTTLEYKGLRLDIRGTFQKGGDKYWAYGEDQFQMNRYNPKNVNAMALDRWTPENPDAKYPSFRSGYYTNKINDFWLYDASFFKIQEINLSYYLPEKILEKIKMIKRMNVYVSVYNVCTFTKYPGYNVESYDPNPIRSTIMDNSTYPNERIFRIGTRVIF